MKRLLSLCAVLLLASAIGVAQKKPSRSVARKSPPAKQGKVTSAHVTVNTPRYTGACPAKLLFHGTITTNGPAEVKYTWKSFDGGTWGGQTVTFEKAGTKPVTQDWTLGGPGQPVNGWMQMEVTAPNALHSAPAKFMVNCGGGGHVVKQPPRVIKKK